MEQKILDKLEEKLYKKYKSLQNGYLFIDNSEGIIVLNWSCCNDTYINYKRINQIITFMINYLKKENQEGYVYTATHIYKIE